MRSSELTYWSTSLNSKELGDASRLFLFPFLPFRYGIFVYNIDNGRHNISCVFYIMLVWLGIRFLFSGMYSMMDRERKRERGGGRVKIHAYLPLVRTVQGRYSKMCCCVVMYARYHTTVYFTSKLMYGTKHS